MKRQGTFPPHLMTKVSTPRGRRRRSRDRRRSTPYPLRATSGTRVSAPRASCKLRTIGIYYRQSHAHFIMIHAPIMASPQMRSDNLAPSVLRATLQTNLFRKSVARPDTLTIAALARSKHSRHLSIGWLH